MVSPSLEGLGQPRRNDPNYVASHDISNKQQAALHHAKRRETLLALVLSVISPIEAKWVFEHVSTASNVTPCLA
jgi:hypothetical protein